MLASGCQSQNIIAATGPETFTFEELLYLLASEVGTRVRPVHTPPSVGFALTRLMGLLQRDVMLTRDEVEGLMDGLLTSNVAPVGLVRLSDWIHENSDSLGLQYVSELRRNFRRQLPDFRNKACKSCPKWVWSS